MNQLYPPVEPIDASLHLFLQSRDEVASQKLLAQLLSEYAEPIIKQTIWYKLRVNLSHAASDSLHQDVADLFGEVRLDLLAHLRQLKAAPAAPVRSNFCSFVRSITAHHCSEYLRRKHPQRWALKDKLRYLLNHRPEFALWSGEQGEFFCGRSVWRNRNTSSASSESLRRVRDSPQALHLQALTNVDVGSSRSLVELLRAIFEQLRQPVEFDELVNLVANLQGIKEQPTVLPTDQSEEMSVWEVLADARPSIAREYEERLYLRQLWKEVCQLPPRQRTALLLHLRDEQGRSPLGLLTLSGIASERQIAEVLAMSEQEFTALWNELPLADTMIAVLLGETRQQVINLRKAARERLARRMKAFESFSSKEAGQQASHLTSR